MFNAPASVWNAIAETQELRTEWAQQMFPLPQEDLNLALRNEEERLEEETGSQVTAVAYLLTMPLLWEAQAIRNWQDETSPLPSLPPLENADQAVALARNEYLLTPDEAQTLKALLLVEPV